MLRCRDAPIHRALRWGIHSVGNATRRASACPINGERTVPMSDRLHTDGSTAPGARRRARGWISGSLALALAAGGVVALAAPVAAAEEPTAFGEQPALKAWYSAPAGPANDKAGAWEKESIPLGNGFLGASILGGVDSDEII